MFDAVERKALLLSTFAGLSTTVGACAAIVLRPDDKVLSALLGVAIGVMATLSAVEMWLRNGLEHGMLRTTGFVAFGALLFRIVDPLISHDGHAHAGGADGLTLDGPARELTKVHVSPPPRLAASLAAKVARKCSGGIAPSSPTAAGSGGGFGAGGGLGGAGGGCGGAGGGGGAKAGAKAGASAPPAALVAAVPFSSSSSSSPSPSLVSGALSSSPPAVALGPLGARRPSRASPPVRGSSPPLSVSSARSPAFARPPSPDRPGGESPPPPECALAGGEGLGAATGAMPASRAGLAATAGSPVSPSGAVRGDGAGIGADAGGAAPGGSPCSAAPPPSSSSRGSAPPPPGRARRRSRELLRLGVLMAVTMTLHNLPEGLGVAFSTYADVGPVVALAIAVHNVPEGMIVAGPVFAATGSRLKAVAIATLSGLSEPLGALVAIAAAGRSLTPARVHASLAAVGGVMLAACRYELWPEARKCKAPRHLAGGVLAGGVLMLWTLWVGI